MALTSRARSRTLGPGLVVLLVLALLPLVAGGDHLRYVITVGMIYGIAAVGLDVFSGYAGVLSICTFAFVACGSYTSAVLSTKFGWNLWLTLPAAIVATGLIALVIGTVIVRLADLGAALATFFFAFVAVVLIQGPLLSDLTRSTEGIYMEQLRVGDWDVSSGLGFYIVTWALLLIVLVVSSRFVNSRGGRTLRLIKRSEVVSSSFGVNSYTGRLSSFVFSAAVAGVAGFLFAQATTFVSPESFNALESVLLLAMVVVGGMGSLVGPIIGAVVFEMSDVSDISGSAREIIFAVLLLLFLVLLPQGIYGGLERLRIFAPISRSVDRFRSSRRRGQRPAVDSAIEDRGMVRLIAEGPQEPEDVQTPALEFREVGVHFRGIAALSDVSVCVPKGSIYAIMGPNGAGKTTLLNCVSGIQQHRGQVLLFGRSLTGARPQEVRRLGVTRTFQHPSLVDDLSVWENVEIGSFGTRPSSLIGDLVPRGSLRRRERADRSDAVWALDLVGFPAARRNTLAGDLTLAEQKLVDVARAIAGRPTVLLMDEPTAGLEVHEMNLLANVIKKVRDDSGVTVLVIAHHVGFLRGIADDATVLDFGTVLASGPPSEVIAREDVATVFLGVKSV